MRLGKLLLLLLLAATGASAQTLTTVSDKLVTGSGVPVAGTLKITAANSMVAADGTQVVAGQVTNVQLSSTGTFSVSLVPTIGAAPFNSFYYVDYTTFNSRVREQWTVPISTTPVKLQQVRIIWPLPPNVLIPSSQFVPPPSCTPIGATVTNLVLRYTTNPVGWICAPDNSGAVEFNLENPTPADAGKFQWEPKNSLTITRIYCDTDPGNTVSINFDLRQEGNTNTPAASQLLAAPLVCNSSGASTTIFLNASVPGANTLALLPQVITGTPGIVRVHIEYLLN